MAKKPHQVTMRIVGHVTVHVNAENDDEAEEKAGKWLDAYFPKVLEDDVFDAKLHEIENVDTFELDEADAKVDEDNKDLA
jgi:hypothetical protein